MANQNPNMHSEHDLNIMKLIKILASISCVVFFLSVLGAFNMCFRQIELDGEISACEQTGKIYDEKQKACRTKTTSERFNDKCSSGKTIDGKTYTCAELKNLGLEKAYLDNTIIKHGNTLYERGTSAEIAAGKQAGKYCLSASDAWNHIGEMRCVVFSYTQLSCYNGYCFLNEKKDYKTGFVAFFGKYNMYSWQEFQNEYKSGVSNILVCGQIKLYQGHPEIRITNPSREVIKNPNQSHGAYAYSCKAAQ